jgi:hypothetical protein
VLGENDVDIIRFEVPERTSNSPMRSLCLIVVTIGVVACRSGSPAHAARIPSPVGLPAPSSSPQADNDGNRDASDRDASDRDASDAEVIPPFPFDGGNGENSRHTSARRLPARQSAVQIIVLLNDDLNVLYDDHAEKNLPYAFWQGVLARCPATFVVDHVAHLDRAVRNGSVRPLHSKGVLDNFFMPRYFEIDCDRATDGEALVSWLLKHPKVVEDAWVQGEASDP